MATLKFLDPRATVNSKERALVPGLETLEGKVVGIIDNGQANSTDMFKELASVASRAATYAGSPLQNQAYAYARRAQADHGGDLKPV